MVSRQQLLFKILQPDSHLLIQDNQVITLSPLIASRTVSTASSPTFWDICNYPRRIFAYLSNKIFSP